MHFHFRLLQGDPATKASQGNKKRTAKVLSTTMRSNSQNEGSTNEEAEEWKYSDQDTNAGASSLGNDGFSRLSLYL